MKSQIAIFRSKPVIPVLKKFILTLPAVLLISFTCQASDKDSGFYAGMGLSNVDAEEDAIGSSSSNGISFIAGYSYSPYLSSEVTLFDIGDQKELGMKGQGISFSVLGRYPIFKNVNLFAELGSMTVDVKIDESQNATIGPSGDEELKDGKDSSLYYGFGAQYEFDRWTVGLKKTRIDLDADFEITTLQAHYHF